MALIAGTFFYTAYLQTYMMDEFKWGSSNHDGLYLLVIPVVLLPLLIVLNSLKWFILRRLDIDFYLKRSHFLYVSLGLLIFIFASLEGYAIGLLLGVIAGVLAIIEAIILGKKLMN